MLIINRSKHIREWNMKLLAMMSAVFLAVTASSALALEEKDIAGKWELKTAVSGITGEKVEVKNKTITEFTADGNFSFSQDGNVVNTGKYKIVTDATAFGDKMPVVRFSEVTGPTPNVGTPDMIITEFTKDELTLSLNGKDLGSGVYKRIKEGK